MNHIPALIQDLALILASAGLATVLFKWIKQPVVLGYILAGFIIGPHFWKSAVVSELPSIQTWAEIGIIFLLFGLGLEFNFKKLTQVGTSALITGIIEISTMITLGYFTGQVLGWKHADSLFLGGILAISSTTIIIRAVEELKLKNKKFVSLVFGILIIEDLVAVLLLVLLTTLSVSQKFEGTALLGATAKLGFFLVLCFSLGIFAIPSFLQKTKSLLNDETLLIVALGLCLSTVLASSAAGFSPALGAFLMGSILAGTPQAEEIEKLLKPVKNLFAAVFFVSVGMLINPNILLEHTGAIVLISTVLVLGKTLSVTAGSLISGQALRPSIETGFTLGQIGEFSFIIASLGATLNVTSSFLYPIAVAVSAITTLLTPYSIRCADPTFEYINKKLPERWRSVLLNYNSAARSASSTSEWRKILFHKILRSSINSAIVVGLFVLGDRVIQPLIYEHIGSNLAGRTALIVSMMFLVSPFLWALAFGGNKENSIRHVFSHIRSLSPLIVVETLRIGLALVFFAAFILKFGSFKIGISVIAAVLTIVGIFFWGRIESVYQWFEERFLKNLNQSDHKDVPPQPTLAPWDAHISIFGVPPEASFVGKSIMDLAVREKFGVTIALVERGSIRIMAPPPDTILYPGDRLGIIGNDDQLQNFKTFIDNCCDYNTADNEAPASKDISLVPVIFNEKSSLIGQSIRQSELREKTSGLVVGIERNGKRLLNPNSETIFEIGDLVWIVGDKEKISHLNTYQAKSVISH